MRSGFREVASLRRDRFLIADIPISMPVHARRCRAERFHAERFHALRWRCQQENSLMRSNLAAVRCSLKNRDGHWNQYSEIRLAAPKAAMWPEGWARRFAVFKAKKGARKRTPFLPSGVMLLRRRWYSRLRAWSEVAPAILACLDARERWWRGGLQVPPLRLLFQKWQSSKASLQGNGDNQSLYGFRTCAPPWNELRNKL